MFAAGRHLLRIAGPFQNLTLFCLYSTRIIETIDIDCSIILSLSQFDSAAPPVWPFPNFFVTAFPRLLIHLNNWAIWCRRTFFRLYRSTAVDFVVGIGRRFTWAFCQRIFSWILLPLFSWTCTSLIWHRRVSSPSCCGFADQMEILCPTISTSFIRRHHSKRLQSRKFEASVLFVVALLDTNGNINIVLVENGHLFSIRFHDVGYLNRLLPRFVTDSKWKRETEELNSLTIEWIADR